jgi:hypothetical protein
MVKRPIRVIALVVAGLASWSAPASAECVTVTVPQAFDDATQVFLADVISNDFGESNGPRGSYMYFRVGFRIVEQFKGPSDRERTLDFIVQTGSFPFRHGQRVLVYAKASERGWSAPCPMTREADVDDSPEFDVLRQLMRAPLNARQSAGRVRLATQAGVARGDWSAPVEGLRGRLIVATVEDAGGPLMRLELELENVRDVSSPIAIWWDRWSAQLDLSVEDGAGTPLPRSVPAGNEIWPPPYWLHIPSRSSLRMVIANGAYEYPSDRVWFRPIAVMAWELPRNGSTVYVRGTLVPRDPAEPHPLYRAWRGPLSLPRVALPSVLAAAN